MSREHPFHPVSLFSLSTKKPIPRRKSERENKEHFSLLTTFQGNKKKNSTDTSCMNEITVVLLYMGKIVIRVFQDFVINKMFKRLTFV